MPKKSQEKLEGIPGGKPTSSREVGGVQFDKGIEVPKSSAPWYLRCQQLEPGESFVINTTEKELVYKGALKAGKKIVMRAEPGKPNCMRAFCTEIIEIKITPS